eukprot:364775-Chlamydomonas_euryale.AAC.6
MLKKRVNLEDMGLPYLNEWSKASKAKVWTMAAVCTPSCLQMQSLTHILLMAFAKVCFVSQPLPCPHPSNIPGSLDPRSWATLIAFHHQPPASHSTLSSQRNANSGNLQDHTGPALPHSSDDGLVTLSWPMVGRLFEQASMSLARPTCPGMCERSASSSHNLTHTSTHTQCCLGS